MKKTYVTTFCLREICETIGVEIPEKYKDLEAFEFTNVAYSEKFISEDGAFFINSKNGDDIDKKINKAISEKAKFVFINSKYADNPLLEGIPYIAVEKPFSAVIKLSASIREKLGVKVVGITGSLGKTTTKDVIFSVLNNSHKAKKSIGNQNTIFPIFENLQKMSIDTEYFVQEFGAASPHVMPRTVEACVPDVGIITNISDPHLDVFGTRENILKEKLRLIKKMSTGCPAFLNYDDPLLKKVKLKNHPIISYAIKNKNADYYADNIKEFDGYITFNIIAKGKRIKVKLNARGKYNVGNALVAFAVGEWFGLSTEDIVEGIASYKSEGVRQNLTNVGGYNLFIDCYNIAPVSLVNDINILDELPIAKGGNRIAVIGDMNRLGDQAEKLHIETAKKIGKTNLDIAFCFGDKLAVLMANELKKYGIESYCTNDRTQLNRWLEEKIKRKDIVLFKGPVMRLLSKTIDQVYGTSLHITSEHFEWETANDFRVKIIWEKYDTDKKLVALIAYNGEEKSIKIPSMVKGAPVFSVGPKCFKDNNTIEKVSIPEPIVNIAPGAFYGCESVIDILLPKTLKSIEKEAFTNCKNLKKISIPEGVIEIGDKAFNGCDSLKKVVIPSTVGHIGEEAFPKTCEVIHIAAKKEKINVKAMLERIIRKQKRKIKKCFKNAENKFRRVLR